MLNSFQHLPRLLLRKRNHNGMRGRPRIKYGVMAFLTTTKAGDPASSAG